MIHCCYSMRCSDWYSHPYYFYYITIQPPSGQQFILLFTSLPPLYKQFLIYFSRHKQFSNQPEKNPDLSSANFSQHTEKQTISFSTFIFFLLKTLPFFFSLSRTQDTHMSLNFIFCWAYICSFPYYQSFTLPSNSLFF